MGERVQSVKVSLYIMSIVKMPFETHKNALVRNPAIPKADNQNPVTSLTQDKQTQD